MEYRVEVGRNLPVNSVQLLAERVREGSAGREDQNSPFQKLTKRTLTPGQLQVYHKVPRISTSYSCVRGGDGGWELGGGEGDGGWDGGEGGNGARGGYGVE